MFEKIQPFVMATLKLAKSGAFPTQCTGSKDR